jgi:hypothetical protein
VTRRHRTLLQAELAAPIGVTKSAVFHWEDGHAEIRLPRLETLADALLLSGRHSQARGCAAAADQTWAGPTPIWSQSDAPAEANSD